VWQIPSSSSPRQWPCGPVVQTSPRDGMGMPSLPLAFSPFSCAAPRISACDLIVVPPVAWQQIGDLPAKIQFVQRRSLASTDSLLRPFASLLQGRSGRTASRAAIFLADLLKSPDPLSPNFATNGNLSASLDSRHSSIRARLWLKSASLRSQSSRKPCLRKGV
jgi:hypothetical protein